MNLFNAAKYFDRLRCQDAYGDTVFRGQMDLYDDAVRDGFSTVRRILSVAPGTPVPPRGAIRIDSTYWLVGESHTDYFQARPIRDKHILHKADGLAQVRTFREWLADDPGYTLYAATAYTRSAKQIEFSSTLANVYELFYARVENAHLPEMFLVTLAGRDYISHDPYQTEGGFGAVYSVQLPAARATLTFISRAYDPVTDSWKETPKDVTALRLRWQEHYRYFARYSTKYTPGDMQFVVLKDAVTPGKGDVITLGGVKYTTVTHYDEGDVWAIHGRPA
jgi:hypothetical protein